MARLLTQKLCSEVMKFLLVRSLMPARDSYQRRSIVGPLSEYNYVMDVMVLISGWHNDVLPSLAS